MLVLQCFTEINTTFGLVSVAAIVYIRDRTRPRGIVCARCFPFICDLVADGLLEDYRVLQLQAPVTTPKSLRVVQ